MAEKYYKVAESDLVAIADRTRTMAGTTKGMTLDDIIYWLGRVIYIPQGNASSVGMTLTIESENSNANGVLPNVIKGNASSVGMMLVLYDDCTAVGTLSESA